MTHPYLEKLKPFAIELWHTHKILPSICGVQGALESGYGGSKLSQPPYNNQFGIKNSPDWKGRAVNMATQEWINNSMGTVTDAFRAYDSIEESIRDYGNFFTSTEWRRNNYRAVIGETNYKIAAQALKNAGYATDPNYPEKLIRIIEQYNLTEWDREALNNLPTIDAPMVDKTVGGSISDNAKNFTNKLKITVIGDSLGVGTKPYLENFGWDSANYSVYGSRQWTHPTPIYDGTVQLKEFINNGSLNEYVVFIMGTNRGVRDSEIKNVVGLIGNNRKLLLVDTASEVGHRSAVSRAYEIASKEYANVFYVDWSSYGIPNISRLYAQDGANGTHIHMNGTGYELHAEYIIQGLYEAANINWNDKKVIEQSGIGEENGTTININEIDYSDGVYVSPKGESIVYNPKLNDRFGFKSKNGKVMWIDSIIQIDSDNDKEMMSEAIEYMKKHATPAAQYTVKLKEWNNSIAIGDVGLFIDHKFNPPLYIEARILNITTSDTNENSNTITIGNVIELHPKEKEELRQLQKELIKVREDLIDDYMKGEPIKVEIDASNGSIISKEGYIHPRELARNTVNISEFIEGTTIEIEPSRKKENTFYFSGKIEKNIQDNVDTFIPKEESVSNADITDISINPEGEPVPENDVNLSEFRKLIVGEFKADFIGESGNVVISDTIPVYEESVFNFPIVTTGDPIRKIIVHTNTKLTVSKVSFKETGEVTLENTVNTKLTVKLIQSNEDVTGRFVNFLWTRVSKDNRLDEGWNDAHKFLSNMNTLILYPDDIYNNESMFICRVYTDDWKEMIGSSSIVIKTSIAGKSAYELAVENGFIGTESEWIESLRGSDGKEGVPGKPGSDGKPTYIHTAWADSPLGDNFSVDKAGSRTYVGFYVDGNKDDPLDYSLYEWTRITGKDGLGTFTYIAYANSDNGTVDFTRTETNRDYMGQYVRPIHKNLSVVDKAKIKKGQEYVELKTTIPLQPTNDYVISFTPKFSDNPLLGKSAAEGNGTNEFAGEGNGEAKYMLEGAK